MTPLLGALSALALGLGLLTLILELTRKPVIGSRNVKKRTPLTQQLTKRLLGGRSLYLVLGIIGGVALFLRTGWVVVLIAIPLGAVLLPAMFSTSRQNNEIDQLEALESWSRALSGLVSTGATSLAQAISTSLPNAPEILRPNLNNLVARLNSRWEPKRAFKAFADELDDPTADIVAAHLILASQLKLTGLDRALEDLSAIISEEIRQRREIQAARETNRTTAKWVTIITIVVMIGAATVMSEYFSFYRTPIGQAILALILGAYAGALKWMHSLSKPNLPPRILVSAQGGPK